MPQDYKSSGAGITFFVSLFLGLSRRITNPAERGVIIDILNMEGGAAGLKIQRSGEIQQNLYFKLH